MEKPLIYADNAATTKISRSVFNAMEPYLKYEYGNPSSIYSIAHTAAAALQESRRDIADTLGAKESEIYFTSCGTESDNWAIKSTARALAKQGKNHVISTNFEHHAVLHSLAALEREGINVTYLPVDEQGLITAEQVAEAIDEKTALVTVMYVNNEIGTVLPIGEIAAVCKKAGVLFHTDAVQAMGHIPINLSDLGADMLSLSGHKIHAPKGVGLLYVKNGVKIDSYMDGGAQERGKRAGTENVAFIVGLAQAIKDAATDIKSRELKTARLRDSLLYGIQKNIPKIKINGSMVNRIAGNLNVSFEGIEGEGILLMLDSFGICASSGSACTSGSLDPSHVLLALGLDHELAHGSLRITLNEDNTQEEVDYILDSLIKTVDKLRRMSPVWND